MLVHASEALGVLHLKGRPEHTGSLLPQAFLPSGRHESSSTAPIHFCSELQWRGAVPRRPTLTCPVNSNVKLDAHTTPEGQTAGNDMKPEPRPHSRCHTLRGLTPDLNTKNTVELESFCGLQKSRLFSWSCSSVRHTQLPDAEATKGRARQ